MTTEFKPAAGPIRLVYLIGTYPGLTTTFIDREITTLRQMDGFEIKIISLRYPPNLASLSPEQQALAIETLYLIPLKWADFNYLAFLAANFYFFVYYPLRYLGTLLYLLTRRHPNLRAWLKTIPHFGEGVYAAYLLRKEGFDHLHVHFMDRAATVALVVSRLSRKTYSLTAHAADIYIEPVLAAEKLSGAQFVVTVSRFNKEHLLQLGANVNPARMHVLHPWVDLAQFTPPANRGSCDCLHILSVGRLVEKKGHCDLVDACKLLNDQGLDFECRIVGEGPLRADLEKQIARHGLESRVRLLGGQPQSQVRELLSGWADVFALPCVIASNSDRDGMPVSMAEAMAMELPVISTDIIGIRELVQGGTGILVSSHHPIDLSRAFCTIRAMSPRKRAEMGKHGRAVVSAEFDLPNGIQSLAGLFQKTIAGNYYVDSGSHSISIGTQ